MTNNLARANEEKISPERLPPSEERADIVVPEPLSDEAQHRLTVVQRLQRYQDQADYRSEQARAAKELEISVRSLYRLQRQYREDGIAGIKRQDRSDEGHFRVTEAWQAYIVKAYQEGNRGQRATSRAQVAKLVKSHAAELGEREAWFNRG